MVARAKYRAQRSKSNRNENEKENKRTKERKKKLTNLYHKRVLRGDDSLAVIETPVNLRRQDGEVGEEGGHNSGKQPARDLHAVRDESLGLHPEFSGGGGGVLELQLA